MRSQQARESAPPTTKKANKGRNEQLVRVLGIIRDLDRMGGQDVYELAERYGATPKTIQRDLQAIAAAGLPLVDEHDGKRKRWRIAYKDKLAQLSSLLDASHYLALRVAMSPGAPMDPESPLFAALEDLTAKIEKAIGPQGHAQLQAIEACFASHDRGTYQAAPPDVLWPLVDAIHERRLCEVTYRAPRPDAKDRRFEVLPLRLLAHQGALYLVCWIPKHDNVGMLNLQRLQKLDPTDRTAKPPDGLDLTSLEGAAFGVFLTGKPTTYRLRFGAAFAPYIRERRWHPTQSLRELPQGVVELTFRCDASPEVGAWVQSWGDGVEVLEPEEMRGEMRELGEWLVGRYKLG